ncbi:MAG: hypothetical protein ACRDWW_02930 [Acidimicrobiales bacterium]
MVSATTLPDEAVDMTVSELHAFVLHRLVGALRTIFGDGALVLSEIFLRVTGPGGAEQVSPDLLIIPGAKRGARKVYHVPAEPVPEVTVEILSAANYEADGRARLEQKRDLLGRIGVPTHIEIDRERGYVTVWANTGTALAVTGPPDNRYAGPALGGLRLEAEPGEVRMWMPTGRLGASAESARADAEAARADRLAEMILRRHGIDPEEG